jgi:hypothetical protein
VQRATSIIVNLGGEALEAVITEVSSVTRRVLNHLLVINIDIQRPRAAEEQSREEVEPTVLEHSNHLVLLHVLILYEHLTEVLVEIVVLHQLWENVAEVSSATRFHFCHVLEQQLNVQRSLLLESHVQS